MGFVRVNQVFRFFCVCSGFLGFWGFKLRVLGLSFWVLGFLGPRALGFLRSRVLGFFWVPGFEGLGPRFQFRFTMAGLRVGGLRVLLWSSGLLLFFFLFFFSSLSLAVSSPVEP